MVDRSSLSTLNVNEEHKNIFKNLYWVITQDNMFQRNEII